MVARFKKATVTFIINKGIPVLCDRVRIKIRFAHHSQDTSGGWFQYNYRSSPVSQRIVCRCLKICIQTGDHGITLILFSQEFIFHLFQKK